MFSFTRLNGILGLTLLLLISSVAARSPFSQQRRVSDVDVRDLKTNAARMAAGFPPLKPRNMFSPTKVAAREPAPSATVITGRVKVNKRDANGNAGLFLGYLAKSVDHVGSDAGSLKLDPTILPSQHLTVSFLHSASSGNSLDVKVSHADVSYPNLGFAFDGTSSPKLVKGKYNYLVATNPTSPGTAASAVGNSLEAKTGPRSNRVPANPNSESAIWKYTKSTRHLTAKWVNPGPATLSTTKIFFNTLTNTFFQGTDSDNPWLLYPEVIFTVV